MDVGCGNGYPVAIPAMESGAKFMCADGMQKRLDQLKKSAGELGIPEKNYETVEGFYPGADPELIMYGGKNKYDAVFTARTIHIGDVENFMACLRAIFSQLKPGGKIFLETTPAEASFYQSHPKLKSDYQERLKAGIKGPWVIKSRDYLGEEWWGMPSITLANSEEVTEFCEDVGFVIDETRTDMMRLGGFDDIIVGVIATKPVA